MDEEQRLDRALEGLATEIEPRTDLWPAISEDIGARARQRERWSDWRRLGVAATVVLAANVIITLALTAGDGPRGSGGFVEPSGSDLVQPVVDFGEGVRLGPDYIQDQADLRDRMDEALEHLDAETRALVERDLADLRAAQRQIGEAMVADPSNPHLQRMLIRSLQDEVLMLGNVERLSLSMGRGYEL